jgi:dihydrofolate reductase
MISIIVAIAKNNVIGKKNELPWYLPEDMKHFKQITDGQTVLMGSKTFESIVSRLGKPLPNRKNIVISSDPNYAVPEGVVVNNDLDKALADFKNQSLFVIGGASIYKQTIEKADKLYITEVDQEIDGDAFFPEIDLNKWEEISRDKHERLSFVQYNRKQK